MKKWMSLLLAALLFLAPALSLAEAVEVEALGVTVEVPEGYTVTDPGTVNEENQTVTFVLANADDTRAIMMAVFADEAFAAVDLASLDEAGIASLAEAMGVAGDEIGIAEDGTLYVTDAEGTQLHCIAVTGPVMVDFAIASTEPLTEEDGEVFYAFVASVVESLSAAAE